jgi:hypothetical protein
MYFLPAATISGCIAHFLTLEGHASAADAATRRDEWTVAALLSTVPPTPGVRLARAWAAGRRLDVDRALGAYERTGALDIA